MENVGWGWEQKRFVFNALFPLLWRRETENGWLVSQVVLCTLHSRLRPWRKEDAQEGREGGERRTSVDKMTKAIGVCVLCVCCAQWQLPKIRTNKKRNKGSSIHQTFGQTHHLPPYMGSTNIWTRNKNHVNMPPSTRFCVISLFSSHSEIDILQSPNVKTTSCLFGPHAAREARMTTWSYNSIPSPSPIPPPPSGTVQGA